MPAAAGRLRQDRAGAADRCAALRPPALCLRARRADGQRACRTTPSPRCASCARRAWSGATSCWQPRAPPTTAPAPAPSTAPPTATRCCSRRWACTCPAPPSCTRTTAARGAHARGRAHRARHHAGLRRYMPIGRLVDERVIVNAMVGAAGHRWATNHLIHWVAVARAAGILIDWTDFAELSKATPLLARVYPNGSADVNQFQAAGGPGFVLRELIDAGLMHADVATVADEDGLPAYGAHCRSWKAMGRVRWQRCHRHSRAMDRHRCAPARPSRSAPRRPALLQGNLGRAVIKTSAVPDDRHVVEAPAIVFDSQEGPAGRLQGRRAGTRLHRRGALPGPARQRHARAAQADAAAGGAAGQGLQGGAGHRRPHERCVGQGAGSHPREPRGLAGGPLARCAR
jgi:hypothetical protein